MKIGVLSDIHGNSAALEAVLEDAKRLKIDYILVLGDIVGYYYYPDKVLEMLANWDFDIIKGNHEKILESILNEPSAAMATKLKYGSGHEEAINKLTDDQLAFLKDLPETKSVKFDNISLLMCHGSPWSNEYYIYPDCENDIILRCDSIYHDFVLIGHSHYAFAIKNKNSILINPGSVGQSRQKGGKASWCVINTTNKCFHFVSSDYDVEDLVDEVTRRKDNKYLSDILKR